MEDFGSIIGIVIFGALCYWAGKMSMLNSIIQAVVEEHEAEQEEQNANKVDGELTIEKHKDTYYAYVGQLFAGQSTTFEDLVAQIKSNKKIGSFKVNKNTVTDVLTEEERGKLVSALVDAYGEKVK